MTARETERKGENVRKREREGKIAGFDSDSRKRGICIMSSTTVSPGGKPCWITENQYS